MEDIHSVVLHSPEPLHKQTPTQLGVCSRSSDDAQLPVWTAESLIDGLSSDFLLHLSALCTSSNKGLNCERNLSCL